MAKSKDSKRVYVYMASEQHMKLKIRLDYHGIGMSEFVRACSESLIDRDPIMEEFVESYREGSGKHSKRNNKIASRDNQIAETIEEELNLDGDEIEDIFDLIEEDHPEI